MAAMCGSYHFLLGFACDVRVFSSINAAHIEVFEQYLLTNAVVETGKISFIYC